MFISTTRQDLHPAQVNAKFAVAVIPGLETRALETAATLIQTGLDHRTDALQARKHARRPQNTIVRDRV